jgi:hypothetical protein
MDVKFKIDRKHLRLRIRNVLYGGLKEEEAQAIDEYVQQNQLGRRIAYDIWRFNNKAALTMFLLKWQ